MSGYVLPKAAWKVTLDGGDLTSKMAPRLISLSLTEDIGEKADRLEITLSDHDGKMALPKRGAVLTVALGWERGTGVTVGMVAKGSFVVDEVSWSTAPDQIRVCGHSANFSGAYRNRKNKSHHGKTLGQIVASVAGENGLSPKCHPDLSAIVVTSAEQASKSDMQFLRDLGRRYDAVATVKAGSLIFAPVNAATTASGRAIPTLTITRRNGDRAEYEESSRDGDQNGAEAQYFDHGSGRRVTVGAGGATRKRLKRTYASKADAQAAAQAHSNRLARAAGRFKITLAYGDPRIAAGARAKVSGFKSQIDAKAWRIANVQHRMDKSGGLKTDLDLYLAH